MFEQRLKDIVTEVYSGRILVASNYNARETLFSKGLTPALFLHPFYTQQIQQTRVVYSVKDRSVRDMCPLSPIDLEEYDAFKEDKMNKILKERLVGKSKLPKELTKNELCSKARIEAYLKSLNFFWFEETARTFLYCLTLEDSNFRVSTLEQPLGLVYVIEIGAGSNVRAEYDKVRKEADIKIKKMYSLNTKRLTNFEGMVVLLFNSEKGGTMKEMEDLKYTLQVQYRLVKNQICLIEINGQDARDSVDWSSYPRITIKHSYTLRPSDPVRIIGQTEENELKKHVSVHRERIRVAIENRMKSLCSRYEESNTAKNKFFNFFKSPTSEKSYTAEEVEAREIADTLFLLGDYKRALDVYKDLSEKCEEGNRDGHIQYNLSEMIQISKFMQAMQGGHRNKTYESITKYAEKSMFKKASSSKMKLYRYFIFLVFAMHGLKVFQKDFAKNVLYYYIKKAVNEEAWTEAHPYPSPIPCLVHEQYANLNLLYPSPQPRRYAYDVVRVASKFNQFRLFEHHLRCLLIAGHVYEGSFPSIQKYLHSALSRTYLELKKYRLCVERIQLTWKSLLAIYEDGGSQNKEDNEFTKMHSNQTKALNEVEREDPHELNRESEDCIQIPKISDLMVEVQDEGLDGGDNLGARWQDVGDPFLSETELTSRGMNKKSIIKTLQLFDSFTPEEKELSYRMKNLPNGNINEAILKRNSRTCFVGEPVTVSFSMKNILPLTVQISNIKLHLKGNIKCKMSLVSPQSQKLDLKQGHKAQVVLEVVPLEQGLLELSHISWTVFKMISIYRFKEPWETRSPMKSLYFKLHVLEQVGQLKAKMEHANKYFEGEETDMSLVLKNQGSSSIQQVYLAIDNQPIFGFRMKKLEVEVGPGQSKTLIFKLRLPVLKASDFSKIATKAIFLYQTGGVFRIHRVVCSFNVNRVADIINLSCERISTTLHFLSFSVKYPNIQEKQMDLLKSMIILGGMDIKKVETNPLGNLVHYFFFLRKNATSEIEQFKFTPHTFAIDRFLDKKCLKQQDVDQSTVKLLFTWWDGEGRCGTIDPEPITVTSTENAPTLAKLPFNAKVLLEDGIDCNFEEDSYGQVAVQFIIKNLFSSKDIVGKVEFIEGDANDFYWEGVTEHHISLSFNEERVMRLRLVVLRPGLFNVARNIRYTIMINKTNSYALYHSDYEQIYLDVHQEGAITTFHQILPSFKKQEALQSQSLI